MQNITQNYRCYQKKPTSYSVTYITPCLPCKVLKMVNRYIRTTLPGPNEKKPIAHARPKRTVRLATALRSCRELQLFADGLLALICLIWIRTKMNTEKLHNKTRTINATTVTWKTTSICSQQLKGERHLVII